MFSAQKFWMLSGAILLQTAAAVFFFVVMGVEHSVADGRHMLPVRWSLAIAALPMVPQQLRVVSAHVMGGCGLAGLPELGVVRPDGRHWQLQNLSVHDGSLFPTSIGANPQLSIYGLVNKLATGLARQLSGRDVRLASAAA